MKVCQINKNNIFCLVIILTWFLALTTIVDAKYIPRRQKPPKDASISSGIRNECDANIILLAPQLYVGQTTSSRPTFVWYLVNSKNSLDNYEVAFSLFEILPDKTKKILGQLEEFQTQKGIIKKSLAQNIPDLQFGKTYLWQVAVKCNNNFDYNIATAEIEIVKISSSLQRDLANAKTGDRQSQLYAEAGFWYDALRLSLQSGRIENFALIDDLIQAEQNMFLEKTDRYNRVKIQEYLQKKIESLKKINNELDNVQTL
jgi:hypothetical protein